MDKLVSKHCTPCKGGVPPLKGDAIEALYKQLKEGWKVIDEHHLEKMYKFTNIIASLSFTKRVGDLAEKEGHHPEVHFGSDEVKLTFWTHKINGLTESDFIMAAKCDALLEE